MTDDHTPTDDPTRALDAVTPPDQWDDITARAAEGSRGGTSLASIDGGRPLRPLLLAAAAAVVVAAIAGGLVLASRDDGNQDAVVAGPSDDLRFEDSSGMVGRTWELTRLVQDGADLTIPQPEQYGTPILQLTADGQATFKGCNGGGAPGRIEAERLVTSGEWMQTLMACGGAEGEALMALDSAMGELMRQGPEVELSGDRLTLRSDGTEAHFVAAIGRPIPPDGLAEPDVDDGSGVAMVPSDDVACAIGLDPDVDPSASWPLGPGPADPPVLDSGWYDGQATQGVWNLTVADQRVEIHVPGFIVRDLVGARTEEVLLGENWSGTIWFTNEWVQVRSSALGPQGSPCTSFTVTVTGSTEAGNRDTAVAIASSLVVRDWPGSDAGQDDRAPAIPGSDEGSEMTRQDWSAHGVWWELEAISHGGKVRGALDTPLGGVGPPAGPPILDSSLQRAPEVLSGCDNLFFELEERNGLLWLALPATPSHGEGLCEGEAEAQWDRLVKILSLGAVPRLVETDRGPVMVMENDEGAAAFRGQ